MFESGLRTISINMKSQQGFAVLFKQPDSIYINIANLSAIVDISLTFLLS